MKDILESADVFEAYARIDYCYYALKNINENLNESKSSIDRAIDAAVGYNDSLKKEAIELVEAIITDKKIINTDYSKDSELLNHLKSM